MYIDTHTIHVAVSYYVHAKIKLKPGINYVTSAENQPSFERTLSH